MGSQTGTRGLSWLAAATTPGGSFSLTFCRAMTLSTLSHFALAFIAGYGMELFFALVDKIVSTFTNKA